MNLKQLIEETKEKPPGEHNPKTCKFCNPPFEGETCDQFRYRVAGELILESKGLKARPNQTAWDMLDEFKAKLAEVPWVPPFPEIYKPSNKGGNTRSKDPRTLEQLHRDVGF